MENILKRQAQEVLTLIGEYDTATDKNTRERLLTKLEQKIYDFAILSFGEHRKIADQERTLALDFAKRSVKQIQKDLTGALQFWASIASGAITIVGAGVVGAGVFIKAAETAKKFSDMGNAIMTAGKLGDTAATVARRSDEAEQTGHQHEKSLADKLYDSNYQASNEYGQKREEILRRKEAAEKAKNEGMLSLGRQN